MAALKDTAVPPRPTQEVLDRLLRRAEALAHEPDSTRRRAAITLARLATTATHTRESDC